MLYTIIFHFIKEEMTRCVCQYWLLWLHLSWWPWKMQINIYTTLLIDRANLCMIWKDFHIDKEMIFEELWLWLHTFVRTNVREQAIINGLELTNTSSCPKCFCAIWSAIYVNQYKLFHLHQDAEMRGIQLFGAGRVSAQHVQSNCFIGEVRG